MGIEAEYPGLNGRPSDREEHIMFRKTILGAAAALTLGVAALAPTAASAGGPGISIHFGGGHGGFGYGGGYGGYWGPSCFIKKVKVWNPYIDAYVWKKKKICY
jgi:hypothetical protein